MEENEQNSWNLRIERQKKRQSSFLQNTIVEEAKMQAFKGASH